MTQHKGIHKLGLGTLSVFLSILMIVYLIPLSVYAELAPTIEGNKDTTAQTEQDEQITDESVAPDALFELTDRREQNVKHFRLSDGSIVAAQYATPIHEQDENGEWQDIDNTLGESGNEYATSNAKIKFAKKITGNQSLFTLHDGKYKITMSLDGAIKKTTGAVTNTQTEFGEDTTQLQKMMTLDKLSAKIMYADILDGVDLEYVLESVNIKENIIVKEKKNSYTYTFTLDLGNLIAALQEDGSIHITDPDSGEVKYRMPAPVVYDAAGITAPSSLSAYTLTQTGNHTYALSVTVNADWMNAEERVFPVTVDPTISEATASTGIDTYVDSDNPTATYYGYSFLAAGTGAAEQEFVTYWKLNTLPTIPNNAYITSANLRLYCQDFRMHSSDTSMLMLGAYHVTSAWNSISYNQMNAEFQGKLGSLLDYAKLHTTNEGQYVSWDITVAVKGWYENNSSNHGIAIRQLRELQSDALFDSFNKSGGHLPMLTLSYRDMKGMETYWSSTSHSAGLAGSGSVNTATGNLTFAIGTLTTTDALFAYTPTLVYNSANANLYNTNTYNSNIPYKYISTGYGLKLNYQETIMPVTLTDETGSATEYYVWADSDGTEHYFYDGDSDGVFNDEDGLQMTLTCNATSYIIEDTVSKTVRTFQIYSDNTNIEPNGGVLKSITDKYGNMLVLTLNQKGQPEKVSVKPDGQTAIDFLTLSYNGLNALYEIKNETSGQVVTLYYNLAFNYDPSFISTIYAGPLCKVEYSHMNGSSKVVDATMEYTYTAGADNVYRLASAKDTLSDVSIVYTYDAGKIASVQEHGGTNTGQIITYSYGTGYTEIRNSGSDDVHGNTDDLITHYSFDHQGRAVSVYTTDATRATIYGASSGEYVSDNENAKNSLKNTATVGGATTNYIFNGEFDLLGSDNETPIGWSFSGNPHFDSTVTESGSMAVVSDDEADSIVTMTQQVTLPAGEYTLFADIATECTLQGSVELCVQPVNETQQTYTDSVVFSAVDNTEAFHRTGSVSFTAADTQTYTITITINNPDNENEEMVYIDSVALIRCLGVDSCSLLNFGSFENTHSNYTPQQYWIEASGNALRFTQDATGLFGKVLTIDGAVDKYFYVSQSIPMVSVEKYDIAQADPDKYEPMYRARSFILSGFGKCTEQVASSSSIATFGLELRVYYHDSTYDLFDVFFNKNLTEWQFASGSFTTDGGKIIEEIEVACGYMGQPGIAYFDNISLIEVHGTEVSGYTYNEDGLPEYYYSPSYTEYYEYDDDKNVTMKLTSDFMKYDYTYYPSGALQTETVSKYDYADLPDGARQEWYDVSRYSADPLNIRETAICTTTHTVNDYGLETATTVQSPGAKPLTSSTSYATTPGSKIFGKCLSQTNTDGITTYYVYDTTTGLLTYTKCNNEGLYYQYDEMQRVTSIYPLDYILISSEYLPESGAEQALYSYDAQGRVQNITTATTTYTYEYDDFGNTKSIRVGDDLLVSYTYALNNGKLEKMTYANGTTVTYYYDSLDRIAKVCYNENEPSEQEYIYTYTVDGALKSVESSTGRGYEYIYDAKGQLTGYAEYDTGSQVSLLQVAYLYNSKQQLDTADTAFSYSVADGDGNLIPHSGRVYSWYEYKSYSNTVQADSSDMLSKMTLYGAGRLEDSTAVITYQYDSLYRMTEKVRTWNETLTMRETYTFADKTSKATTRVGSFTSTVGATSSSYLYSYDSFGNIETISIPISEDEQELIIRYYYDDQQQLVRENNKLLGKTYTYTYDRGGNRTSKTTYTYTTGSLSGLTGTTTNYTYEGDRLTAIGSTAITYDDLGNPLTYGIATYTWQNGRQLTSISMNYGAMVYSFEYNDSGIRTSKTVNGIEHVYTLNGSQIVTESWTQSGVEYFIVYLYDESGAPIGMQYRTSNYAWGVFDNYYFEKNLFGDVVAIYNESGNKIGSYKYDAWGVCTASVESTASTLEKKVVRTLNPFRYRGYYYDTETGFYYLQSRYYNPQWGRFLNADGYINANGDLIGYNMYAYCSNNPVMYTDPTGESITLTCIIVGAVLGAIVGGCIGAYVSKEKTDEVNGWAVAAGAVGGAAVGAIAGWAVGSAITAIGAAASSTVGITGSIGPALYQNWQQAEQGLRDAYNGIKQVFSTPYGNRVVDCYRPETNVIMEAKYGFQGLSQFIKQEIAKDAWLLQNGIVNRVEWHFYYSQISETGGLTSPLLDELINNGIHIIFH